MKPIIANLIRLSLLTITIITACKDEKDISGYYFPVNALKEGKVYEYRFVGKPDVLPEYWYHITVNADPKSSEKKGRYFVSTLYGPEMEPKQLVSEEVVSNGMLLDELHLYFKDSIGKFVKVDPVIISRNVYPFQFQDTTTKYFYKIFFKNPFDSLQTTYLTRTRTYKGKTTYAYKGKDYDCVEFALEEKYADDKEGRWEKIVYGKELYAKGIGLIYYKKGLQADFNLEYELADIYTQEELEKKLK
ncbi:MAG: hypothetical protein ACOYOA_01360 [Saprospiraceae bacterium]|jgi:hypothetical protein